MEKIKNKFDFPMSRVNTRVRPSQHKYIKKEAKRLKLTEGEMFRSIIDYYIENKE